MSIERDESVDLESARTVTLAGREFYVAPVPLRQIIAFAGHVTKLEGLKAENIDADKLSSMAELVWRGLKRAHPRMTLDEFLDMPTTLAELVAALPVVVEQAGGRRAGTGTGETEAANRSTESTGNGSSHVSS